MNIHFYLNNEDETPITSLYDVASNPFSVNDIVSLNVEDLYPVEYNKFNNKNAQIKFIENNNKLMELFRHKKIKLINEGKYMKFKSLGVTNLVIEYHCEFIEEK